MYMNVKIVIIPKYILHNFESSVYTYELYLYFYVMPNNFLLYTAGNFSANVLGVTSTATSSSRFKKSKNTRC